MTSSVPTYYSKVDLPARFEVPLGAVTKEGRLSVAKFETPLLVQTPPVPLTIVSDNVIWFAPSPAFHRFLSETEAHLKAAMVKFTSYEAEAVDNAFKSFFDDDGNFKIRLSSDFALFDESGGAVDPLDDAFALAEGDTVRFVLEMDRACFGKTEFGGLWRAVQGSRVPPPPACLLQPEEPEPEAPEEPVPVDPEPVDETQEAAEFA